MPASKRETSTGLAGLPSSTQPIVVASHRRSGTHLMLDLLRRQFAACRPPFRFGINPHRYLYFTLDRFGSSHKSPAGPDECLQMMATTTKPCLKTHAMPDFADYSEQARLLCEEVMREGVVLYCVRDVRAVMASLLAFERCARGGPEVALSDFIRQEVNGIPRPRVWAGQVQTWLDFKPKPNVMRYENVISDPTGVVDRLAGLLDERPLGTEPTLPRKSQLRIRNRWAQFTGIPSSTNVMGRKRGVKPPDWRTAYSESDLAFLEEHAGDAMRRLGYIKGDDWSTTG